MKKDRNSFFSNYNAQSQAYIPDFQNQPMMNQPMMNQPMMNQGTTPNMSAYGSTSMNSNYYSGPDIATSNELDNRLSKIERQINRLDNRLTKLEAGANSTTEVNENNISNNMYML